MACNLLGMMWGLNERPSVRCLSCCLSLGKHTVNSSHHHDIPFPHLRPQQLGLSAGLLKGPLKGSFTYQQFWKKSRTAMTRHSSCQHHPHSLSPQYSPRQLLHVSLHVDVYTSVPGCQLKSRWGVKIFAHSRPKSVYLQMVVASRLSLRVDFEFRPEWEPLPSHPLSPLTVLSERGQLSLFKPAFLFIQTG